MQQQFRLSDSVASYNFCLFPLLLPQGRSLQRFSSWVGMAGEYWPNDMWSSTLQYELETSEGISQRRNSVSRGFSVCVGFCGCCCFLLCFLQLSVLCWYSRAAWELFKNKVFLPFPLFRSKRECDFSKVNVKSGVQRSEPPGLRYMGKLLSPLPAFSPSIRVHINSSVLAANLVSE